jgi:hypothetical protein
MSPLGALPPPPKFRASVSEPQLAGLQGARERASSHVDACWAPASRAALRRGEACGAASACAPGHLVAELVPIDRAKQFALFDQLVRELGRTMLAEDHLEDELRELDEPPGDPFA